MRTRVKLCLVSMLATVLILMAIQTATADSLLPTQTAPSNSTPWIQITSPNSSQLAIQATSISFMRNALGFDMSRYNAMVTKFFSLSPEMFPQFGDLPHYNIEYNLTSANGNTVTMEAEFVNGSLIHYQLYGPDSSTPSPYYAQSFPTTFSGKTTTLLARYQNFTRASDVQPILDMLGKYSLDDMLGSLNKTAFGGSSTSVTENNLKMKVSVYMNYTSFTWMPSFGGIDFPNALTLGFNNGNLDGFTDWWNLYRIGSTNTSMPVDQAVDRAWQLANEATTVNISGVGNVTINLLKDKARIDLYGAVRENMTAYPFYYIRFPTDQIYYSVDGVEVGIWGDSGQVAFCQSTGFEGATEPSPTSQPTSILTTSGTPDSSSQQVNLVTDNSTASPLPHQIGNSGSWLNMSLAIGVATLIAVSLVIVFVAKRRSK